LARNVFEESWSPTPFLWVNFFHLMILHRLLNNNPEFSEVGVVGYFQKLFKYTWRKQFIGKL
jgi:hypothetical protein